MRGDFPGSGELGEQGLSPGQQRDCRAACKTIRLEPGAKIRILKENRSFFPGWWGKGRFTAFSCHNQAQSLGSQTEYWIFFFFSPQKTNPIFSHSAPMQLQGWGACAPGSGQPCPQQRPRGPLCQKPGTNSGSADAEEGEGWWRKAATGPRCLFSSPGRILPRSGDGTLRLPHPSGIAWVRRNQKSLTETSQAHGAPREVSREGSGRGSPAPQGWTEGLALICPHLAPKHLHGSALAPVLE